MDRKTIRKINLKKYINIKKDILEKKHVYRSKQSGQFLYFTGDYNKYDEAHFNDINGETVDLPIYCSALLKKLKKREIEKTIRWLEKGLGD